MTELACRRRITPGYRCCSPAGIAERGFTLLEIMVALAIFAIVASSLIKSAGQTVRQTSIIQERTLAYMVAENELNQLRSAPRDGKSFPNTGSDRVNVSMANLEWEVLVDFEATENSDMRRVSVTVFKESDLENRLVELVGFIGKY